MKQCESKVQKKCVVRGTLQEMQQLIAPQLSVLPLTKLPSWSLQDRLEETLHLRTAKYTQMDRQTVHTRISDHDRCYSFPDSSNLLLLSPATHREYSITTTTACTHSRLCKFIISCGLPKTGNIGRNLHMLLPCKCWER